MRRFVSMSEFARQGPRELRKQQGNSQRYVFDICPNHVQICQIFKAFVPTPHGPYYAVPLAHPVLTVNNQYDYWIAGRSRTQEIKAMGHANAATDNRSKKEQAEYNLKEAGQEARDLLAWAIDKDNGNGLHFSRG